MLNEWLIVVPARIDSTRLKHKPLQKLGKKSLICRVVDNLMPLEQLGASIIVATDSPLVLEACQQDGIHCEMTDSAHKSGSDRCLEVALRHPQPFVLNVQGDEPMIKIEALKNLMTFASSVDHPAICTLYHQSSSYEGFTDPNRVKVVKDSKNQALYFSRSPIPFQTSSSFSSYMEHMGVYAFTAASLKSFCQSPQSSLESVEKLEQLRAISHGLPIYLVESLHPSLGIDTLEDLNEARSAKSWD